MKKIYFMYVAIPEKIFNKIKYMLGDTEGYRWKHEMMFGLYAWTPDKSIAKEFFEVRNKDIYTLVVKKVDDDEYKYIKDKFNLLKLERRTYFYDRKESNKNSIEIVSTKNEYVCTTMDGEAYVHEFGPEVYENTPYEIFNKKIINALDILGYTESYNLRYGDDNEVDYTCNQSSYCLTPMGNKNKRCENQMNILIYLFNYFFNGEVKRGD